MSLEIIEQAKRINPAFANALNLRDAASNVGSFNPAKKLKLAEQALDEMQSVVAELVVSVNKLKGGNHGSNQQ